MDGAAWVAYHEMLHVIKFVINTKALVLKIEPKIKSEMNWNHKNICDSDWAGYREKNYCYGTYYVLASHTNLFAFQGSEKHHTFKK
jgi:hypothetical protein